MYIFYLNKSKMLMAYKNVQEKLTGVWEEKEMFMIELKINLFGLKITSKFCLPLQN